MPRVSLWFFAVVVIYAIIGMAWGMEMGASGDHSMFPAHAHWNLLGWVSMAIYGTFYALARDAASTKLAWATFVIANVGTLVMVPSVAMVIHDGETGPFLMPAIFGGVIVMIGMICFAISVWMVLLKTRK